MSGKNKFILAASVLSVMALLFFALSFQCKSPTVEKGDGKEVKKEKSYALPFRGLYLPVNRAVNLEFVKNLYDRGRPLGINMFVLDIQSNGMTPSINSGVVEYLKANGAYAAARVVCFQDGLGRIPVAKEQLDKIFALVDAAGTAGFDEVQLDYIRFKDTNGNYSTETKYKFIDELLSSIKAVAAKHRVKLSADLFGRIVFNRNDNIGQQLELFAKHTDVIYPMLYPSHFLDNEYYMSHPGETVAEGVRRGLERLKGTTVQLQPFIQCFKYNIQWSRLSLEKYVEVQIKPVEESGCRGWVAWNAAGEYEPVLEALKNLPRK